MTFGLNFASLSLPSGAVGDWDFSNHDTARRVTKNMLGNSIYDPCLTRCPRRLFSSTAQLTSWWNGSTATFTDNNSTAPDGSNEATTVVYAGGAHWQLVLNCGGDGCQTLTAGNTYIVCLSVKWLGTGSASFKLGGNTTLSTFTATASWQRFTKTFVANGSTDQLVLESPDDISAANFAICDFQLYDGVQDLNRTWASAKPTVIQNRDLVLDGNSGSTVSAGAFQHGSRGMFQLSASESLSAYTVFYVGSQGAPPPNGAWNPVISEAHDVTKFTAGPFVSGSVGPIYNNTRMELCANGCDQEWYDYWGGNSAMGTCIMAHRFDGSVANGFLNGLKLFSNPFNDVTRFPSLPSAPTVQDFVVGSAQQTLTSGYDIKRIIFWDRALTDDEVHLVYLHLKSRYSLTTPNRLVAFVGDSITYGAGGKPFPYDCCPNLSPIANGLDYARSGAGITTFDSGTSIDNLLTQKEPQARYILVCLFGAADLLAAPGVAYANNSLAPYLDARRSAGWKIVLCTTLPRTDQPDGGAQFNINRADYNTTVKAWTTGLHWDALADTGDPATTMGVDTAPNDVSLYQIKVHPTATGAALLEPTVTAAINSIT